MSYQTWLSIACVQLLATVGLTAASSILSDGSGGGNLAAILVPVAIASIVCLVVVLFACTQLCPREDRFKNLEEDGYFPNLDFPNPPRDVDLGLYPPVEDTPGSPVFDALPDVTSVLRQKRHLQSNVSRLRPKVSHVVRDRLDSKEDVENALNRNSIHLKLDRSIAAAKVSAKQNFSRNQLNYIKEVGSGWFGKVLQGDGQNILPGHKKTAAVIQVLKEDADMFDQYAFLQESAPYREIEHTNLLKLFGHCVETMPYLTILELCINGDLKSYLQMQRPNVETIDKQGVLLNFACDIAAGLQAMHQNNYVHRDFAIRNCLVTSDLTVKIGDYGLSENTFKNDYYVDSSGAMIPIRWLAPEVIGYSNGNVSLRHITKDCNLWSFGVALWELVTFGSMPYSDLTNEQVLQAVVFERSIQLQRPEVPVSNVHILYQLMEMCWLDPSQRPSLRELRIMLLHLQSSKDELNTRAFEQKWNQLMPRRNNIDMRGAMATDNADDDDDDDEYYNDSHLGVGGGFDHPGVHNFQMFSEPNSAKSPSKDIYFTELDPSLLFRSGKNLQPDLLPWSNRRGDAADDDLPYRFEPNRSSPVNVLSLEAELGLENLSSFRPANEEEDEEFVLVQPAASQRKLPGTTTGVVSPILDQSPNGLDSGHGKNSMTIQQVNHVVEVHRSSVVQTDPFLQEPLLELGMPGRSTNSVEASSEDSSDYRTKEDRMEEIGNGNAKEEKEEEEEVESTADGKPRLRDGQPVLENHSIANDKVVAMFDQPTIVSVEQTTVQTKEVMKNSDNEFPLVNKSDLAQVSGDVNGNTND